MERYDNILERLKEAKKASGLKNAEIAEKTGISISTVAKILSGATKNASVQNLTAICDAIGADVNYICYGHAAESSHRNEELLVSLYRQTNPEGKEKILSYAEDISKVYKKDSAPCMVSEIEA